MLEWRIFVRNTALRDISNDDYSDDTYLFTIPPKYPEVETKIITVDLEEVGNVNAN